MIVFNFIGLPLSTERNSHEAHELMVHALGHYLLHAGNQPFFHLDKSPVVARQMEHQAWDFAYELLMPRSVVVRLLKKSWGEADLRDHFEVSREFFRKRMSALKASIG